MIKLILFSFLLTFALAELPSGYSVKGKGSSKFSHGKGRLPDSAEFGFHGFSSKGKGHSKGKGGHDSKGLDIDFDSHSKGKGGHSSKGFESKGGHFESHSKGKGGHSKGSNVDFGSHDSSKGGHDSREFGGHFVESHSKGSKGSHFESHGSSSHGSKGHFDSHGSKGHFVSHGSAEHDPFYQSPSKGFHNKGHFDSHESGSKGHHFQGHSKGHHFDSHESGSKGHFKGHSKGHFDSHEPEEYEDRSYEFAYKVKHSDEELDFGHKEEQKSGEVKGYYYVLLPDTRVQHVNYKANSEEGYVAEVTYEGSAEYDSVEKHHSKPHFDSHEISHGTYRVPHHSSEYRPPSKHSFRDDSREHFGRRSRKH